MYYGTYGKEHRLLTRSDSWPLSTQITGAGLGFRLELRGDDSHPRDFLITLGMSR